MKPVSIQEFYSDSNLLLPQQISKEIGHFNVFSISAFANTRNGQKKTMPYNRRNYYKISLIIGHNIAEYADKVIEIRDYGLLFASPRIPYNYIPQDDDQNGHFCIFTEDFMLREKTGIVLDELPLFKAGGEPVFRITKEEAEELEVIFKKMNGELSSDYAYKYDLLRNYVIELIHRGQKLQPATALYPSHNASSRVSSLFAELLERQFPIESSGQTLRLRTAKDFAETLSVHINHLNKVLRETTGKTTTHHISSRIANEAKILLKSTSWTISEIAYSLGFDEVAHFSNFFRKNAGLSPLKFRSEQQ